MKTNKAASKRFRFTASGKVKFKRAGKRHNLGGKSSKKMLGKRKAGYVNDSDVGHIHRLLPFG